MNDDFLKKLQKEAHQQQKLYNSRIIPKAFDPITSFIGEHTFLVLIILAVFTSLVVEVYKTL